MASLLVIPTYSVKGSDWLVPPPGAGVTTLIEALPSVVCSEPGTFPVRTVLLPTVVGTFTPFHCTTVFGAKPLPLIWIEVTEEPMGAASGYVEVSCGAGGVV